MDLTKIVSISGKSGLFKVMSQGKNVVIVESLSDKKRIPVFGHEKMSSLEEISVFTTGEGRPLKEIFKAFHTKLEGKPAADPKSDNSVLQNFFLEMIPDYDQERVYISDIRKMINWYGILQEYQLLDFTEPEEEKKEESAETAQTATPAETTEGTSEEKDMSVKTEEESPKTKETEESGSGAKVSSKSKKTKTSGPSGEKAQEHQGPKKPARKKKTE